MNVIFLDIDGCLNHGHFGKDEQDKFGFADDCVNALKYVLRSVDARRVITSAWRRFDKEPRVSKTENWLDVLERRLNRKGVVAGRTADMEGTVENGRKLTRADEIIKYLEDHAGAVDNYVVVDDEISCYKGTRLEDNVIDCEISTGRGFDALKAARTVRILKGTSGPKAKIRETVGDIVFESVFDDARNMATTLRRIDQELSDAARAEGAGYPAEQLLPRLCKIMYACSGNYNNERYD